MSIELEIINKEIEVAVYTSTIVDVIAQPQPLESTQYGNLTINLGSNLINNTEINVEAGETLPAYSLCRLSGGKLYLASQSDASTDFDLVGIVVVGGNNGDLLRLIFSGVVSFPSAMFITSMPVFMGNSGQITQVSPSSGLILQIGIAITDNQLLLIPNGESTIIG